MTDIPEDIVKPENIHASGVFRCLCGADFDDLELGEESESFMAIIGAPYMLIRCGKCLRGAKPAIGREAAVLEWNKKVAALTVQIGTETSATTVNTRAANSAE